MRCRTGIWLCGSRVVSELIVVLAFLIPVAVTNRCSAQADSPQNATDSDDSAPSQQSIASPDSPQPGEPDEGFPAGMQPPSDDSKPEDEPPDTALDTDLPLRVLLSPLRWGNISLVSLTTYEGYNSNPDFLKAPLGTYLTAINGLVVDSEQFAGWQMSAQYRPFVWISSRRNFESFAAASLSLRTLRRINSNWHWTVSDHLHYSPTHATEQAEGFVANPGGGLSVGNAFLSSGRNVLVNGASAILTDNYGEHSSIAFHANQSFTRLSSYIGGASADNVPAQDAIMVSSGAIWRNHYSFNNTLTLEYNFRAQTSTAAIVAVAGVQSHAASVGWTHKFSSRLDMSASAGPAWSIYDEQQRPGVTNHGRTTLHGSIALSREFGRGGAVLSISRSDGFTGIISDSFHNRYEAGLHRDIGSRLHWSASASYIQQQILNARATNGELFSTQAHYYLSRNLSLFAQVRYLKISGNERIVAPETNGIIGIRWAWVPEKP